MKSIKWIVTDSYIIGKTKEDDLKNKKIASFDLDDTIIKPLDGQKYSKGDDDWELYNQKVVQNINDYSKKGFSIVIISNQKGISRGQIKIEDWQNKIQKIINLLDKDIYIFCAIKDDMYRKPRTGLWDKFIKGNLKDSFFCGDAGGLPKRTINGVDLNKDFSDSDVKFALNLGIKFIHRDAFIFGAENKYNISYPVNFTQLKKIDQKFEPSTFQEVIINVGLPASGKSTFTKDYILPNNYECINQDTLKTKQKCVKLFKELLQNGKSIVVDNTNMSKDSRKTFIDICKQKNIKVRCLLFTTDKNICQHNSYYRNYITENNVQIIPSMVYNMMNKKYEKPELNEGFYKVEEIGFSYDLNNKEKEVYKRFYF